MGRTDSSKLFEAYKQAKRTQQVLNEGVFSRLKAKAAGAGAAMTQPIKNAGAGVKALGHTLVGDTEGAAKAASSAVSPAEAADSAKRSSIVNNYVRNVGNDLVKLNLINLDQKGALQSELLKLLYTYIGNYAKQNAVPENQPPV